MKKTLLHLNKNVMEVDLGNFYDLSIPVKRKQPVNAYDLPDPVYSIFTAGGFTGSVRKGGTVNCDEIHMVPHGNGTHTECVGHISAEPVWLNNCLKEFVFSALLISIEPEEVGGEKKITRPLLEVNLLSRYIPVDALVIRTLPDSPVKLSKRYAGTEPPFFTQRAMEFLEECGIKHLLTDLPSVDAENDKHLTAHHTFWQYPDAPRRDKTITELIYVPEKAEDGYYLLNLQVPALETDASPSRPLIFPAIMKR